MVADRMIEGTRYATTVRPADPGTRHFDRGYTRDLGLAPMMMGAVTFGGGTAAAAGAFGSFSAGEVVLIEGTNLNNGFFVVLAATNDALVLLPTPSAETAAGCTIRATRNVLPVLSKVTFDSTLLTFDSTLITFDAT